MSLVELTQVSKVYRSLTGGDYVAVSGVRTTDTDLTS